MTFTPLVISVEHDFKPTELFLLYFQTDQRGLWSQFGFNASG